VACGVLMSQGTVEKKTYFYYRFQIVSVCLRLVSHLFLVILAVIIPCAGYIIMILIPAGTGDEAPTGQLSKSACILYKIQFESQENCLGKQFGHNLKINNVLRGQHPESSLTSSFPPLSQILINMQLGINGPFSHLSNSEFAEMLTLRR
jgi:hypothetical protein